MAPLTEDGNTSEDGSAGESSYASWATSMVLDAGRRIVNGPVDELAPHYELLHAGANMKLHGERSVDEVSINLSSDRTMLVWRAAQPGAAANSGVVALSTIKKVAEPAPGWFSSPAAGEFVISADGLDVRLEAKSASTKDAWMQAVQALAERAAEDKEGRKLGHEARRRLDLEMRKREAERRKAEMMKGMSGGMKHTAQAMLSR